MTGGRTDDGDGEFGIGERIDRLETIAETLEDGEVGLERARELREEADEHLAALHEELDVGDGEIIELEAGGDGGDPPDREEGA